MSYVAYSANTAIVEAKIYQIKRQLHYTQEA
jgi:hypothetical protein